MRHAIWMLGVSLVLSGLAAYADESQAPVPQPETPPTQEELAQAQPKKVVAELSPAGKLVVKAQDGRAVDFVREVLEHGEVQVLVAAKVLRTEVTISMRPTLEDVLRRVCYHNDLEVLRDGSALLVRLPRPDAPEPLTRFRTATYSLHFKRMQVGDAIERLVVLPQAGVVVEIEDALRDKVIPEVRLVNVSFKTALEAVARTVDAELAWKEGHYILIAKPK